MICSTADLQKKRLILFLGTGNMCYRPDPNSFIENYYNPSGAVVAPGYFGWGEEQKVCTHDWQLLSYCVINDKKVPMKGKCKLCGEVQEAGEDKFGVKRSYVAPRPIAPMYLPLPGYQTTRIII